MAVAVGLAPVADAAAVAAPDPFFPLGEFSSPGRGARNFTSSAFLLSKVKELL